MAKNKTTETTVDVMDFINTVDDETKRDDSRQLIKIMEKASGSKAKMWGPSIVGFGSYHYKYESGHEGDSCLIGFSPRKQAISLYLGTGAAESQQLLTQLGKYKMAKACIYVKKLSDIDETVLLKLLKISIAGTTAKYPSKK